MALFHSHCHLQPNPVTFDNEQTQIFFDGGNEYLVVYKDAVFTVSSLRDRTIPPQSLDFIRKDAVLEVRFSLDKRHICIQRSHTDIDVVNLQDGSELSYSCKGKGSGIMVHGFVWVNNAMCDLAVVTNGGLELLKLSPKLDALKMVKHDKRPIHWFVYSYPNKLMLLCSGKDYSCIQSMQFMPDKVLKMPDFDPEVSSKSGAKKEGRLEKGSFIPCKLYDKLCCVYVFAGRQELIVYQLGKDAIGKLCTINLFSACDHYAVSVIDNLLAVHNTDSGISMIFDVWLQQWTSHPIAAPLPLGGPPPTVEEGESRDVEPAESFVQEWEFEHPHYILDRKAGKMWTLELNLEVLCASSSDKVNLVRCLLKRRDARELVLGVLRTCVREREPLYSLLQIFSIIIDNALSLSNPPPSSRAGKWWYYDPRGGGRESKSGPPSGGSAGGKEGPAARPIDQTDLHRHVFLPIYQSKAVEDDYFIAVTTEYLLGLSSRGMMAEGFMVEFVLGLIVDAKPPRYNVLHQLLQYHVIQDSLTVAQKLLALEDAYKPVLQLALDMLHRLKAHQDLLEALLSRGMVVQAVQYAKDKVPQVKLGAARVLRAARECGDDDAFFVAYRYLQAEMQAQHANHKRSSPTFLPEDNCAEHIAYYERVFETQA